MDPATASLIGTAAGGILGSITGGGSKDDDFNRELKAQRDRILSQELSQSGISSAFKFFQGQQAPMLAAMGQAGQVGANMDTQALQANLARQGLGGTGLGAALGSGLRSGATLQNNMLRAQMAQEAMQSAMGFRQARSGVLMQQALNMSQDTPQQGNSTLQGAGLGMQAGYLLGDGGGGIPGTGPGTGAGGYMPLGI